MTTTIAAIATAPGPAGISVVRISGPSAWETALRVCKLPRDFSPAANSFRWTRFRNPVNDAVTDDGIVLFFAAPHSYTGEEVAELQGHGGRIPARRLLEAVLAAGAIPAEPGEFTKRAFLNGKIDLTQAEAVMELIESKTERAATSARDQLDGRLGTEIESLYAECIDIQAEIEHLLDFDENEIPTSFTRRTRERLGSLSDKMKSLISGWHTGHLLRDGALVVISGRPNAGKSSLLNALLGRDRAIVSAIPGTTRDSIEESFSIDGIPMRLVDTAGIRREASDSVEAEGIERTGLLLEKADINIRVIDLASPDAGKELSSCANEIAGRSGALVALNKTDIAGNSVEIPEGLNCVRISTRTGDGLDKLTLALRDILEADSSAAAGTDISERHRHLLEEALSYAQKASACLEEGEEGLVLAAQQMKQSSGYLAEITGKVWNEDLLDAVFSKFCIGK